MPNLDDSNEAFLGKIRSAIRGYEIFDDRLGKVKNLEDIVSIDFVQELDNGDEIYNVYGDSVLEEDDTTYCSVLLKVLISGKDCSIKSIQTYLVVTDDIMESVLED